MAEKVYVIVGTIRSLKIEETGTEASFTVSGAFDFVVKGPSDGKEVLNVMWEKDSNRCILTAPDALRVRAFGAMVAILQNIYYSKAAIEFEIGDISGDPTPGTIKLLALETR